MITYPINLVGLADRLCLVAGGGPVAQRKVDGLLAGGARVRVVTPEALDELRELAHRGTIELALRPFAVADLDAAFLVIAATDDRALNRSVAAEAMARGMLVNVVDDPEASNFIVPAVVRRGEMTVAVSTGGASPALARRLREELEERFGPEYEDLVGLLAELRPEIAAGYDAGEPRLEAALRLVDDNQIPALLKAGDREGARRRARQLLGEDQGATD